MKDAAKRDAFNLWLACHTQDEIAEAVGWPRQSVTDWLVGIAENGKDTESGDTASSDPEDDGDFPFTLSKEELAAVDHAIDFTAPDPYRVNRVNRVAIPSCRRRTTLQAPVPPRPP
jgi:hypothetical protein